MDANSVNRDSIKDSSGEREQVMMIAENIYLMHPEEGGRGVSMGGASGMN